MDDALRDGGLSLLFFGLIEAPGCVVRQPCAGIGHPALPGSGWSRVPLQTSELGLAVRFLFQEATFHSALHRSEHVFHGAAGDFPSVARIGYSPGVGGNEAELNTLAAQTKAVRVLKADFDVAASTGKGQGCRRGRYRERNKLSILHKLELESSPPIVMHRTQKYPVFFGTEPRNRSYLKSRGRSRTC